MNAFNFSFERNPYLHLPNKKIVKITNCYMKIFKADKNLGRFIPGSQSTC